VIGAATTGGGVQVWVATTPTDMRKGFDGLAEVVRAFLGRDPLSGHLFVFRNRAGHRVKVLWWDRNGLALYYKRIERGTFAFPAALAAGDKAVAISAGDLARLLAGCTPQASR
jgi:transposase